VARLWRVLARRPHHPLRCPRGKTRETGVNMAPSKYFALLEFGIIACFGPSQPGPRGGSRSSRTRDGTWWTQAASRAGGLQGGHPVSRQGAHMTGATCVRQNRVVLAPGVCAPSVAVMQAARPGARISHPQGDGGNSASLPGESTTYAVSPLRREGRMFGFTCMPLCNFASTRFRTVDRGCQPAPGLPCALGNFEGGSYRKTRAENVARTGNCALEPFGN
jgi:hypothetical protein